MLQYFENVDTEEDDLAKAAVKDQKEQIKEGNKRMKEQKSKKCQQLLLLRQRFLVFRSFYTAQKMKFSIMDFFSKCDQIRRRLRNWSYLLKKSLMEKFIFCAVSKLQLVNYQSASQMCRRFQCNFNFQNYSACKYNCMLLTLMVQSFPTFNF